MTTSLAEQLKRLALPESSLLTERKKRKSLLFDATEAGKLDRDAFYEIGLDGLKGLIKLEPAFEIFNESLFHFSSKHLERTVESKEINKKLDNTIDKFLKLLSPYLLLKHSHKALEWLIIRYQIHNFNVDELIGLILPYHETKIFIRILQLINLSLHNWAHWKWLKRVQKQGVHLPKSALVNHALTDSSFLRFICDTTLKTVKVHQKNNCADKLGTLFTFYSVTIFNIFSRKEINNQHITVILPSLIKSLTSNLVDFRAAGYIIVGQLVASNQVTELLLNKNLQNLFQEKQVLKKEQALLLVLIFQTQIPPPSIPPESVNNLTWLVKELSSLATEKVKVGPLVLKLMEACLDCIVELRENVVDAQVLSYTLATEITCDLPHSENLIWLIDSYYEKLVSSQKSKHSELLQWMKELMNSTLEKYNTLDVEHADPEFKKLTEKWKSPDELVIQEKIIADLMKKCEGDNKECAWLQLRPLLLEKIEHENIFEALCKVAPFYDNLVLLLCIEKLLTPKYSDANRLARLSKIFKTKFGGNNSHIIEINNLLKKNKSQNVTEVIEHYFLKQQKESENSIEFEPWLATLQELKQIKEISHGNEVWNLGLKVLLVALPTTFNATYALQLLSLLASLKRKKVRIRFEILKSVMTYLSINKSKDLKWYDLTSFDSEIWLKIRIFEYILEAVHEEEGSRNEYMSVLDVFSKSCFFNQQEFVRFLGSVCCGVSSSDPSPEYKISPFLQVYALHVSWMQLKTNDENVFNSFKSELRTVLCYLLICLSNPSAAIRKATLQVLEVLIVLIKSHEDYSEAVIFDKLLERSQEISLDANQVSVSLYCLLSPCESVQATLQHLSSSCLSRTRNNLLEIITEEDTPLYISLSIMQLLDTVNSPEIIEQLAKLGHKAFIRSKESEVPRMILSNFWQRVNEQTCQVLEKENVWELASKCIKHEKCENLCPAVSFLKCISKEVFNNLSDKRKFQIIECMITARSQAESAPTASAIASVVKKVCIDCRIILPIISQMITLFNSYQKRRQPKSLLVGQDCNRRRLSVPTKSARLHFQMQTAYILMELRSLCPYRTKNIMEASAKSVQPNIIDATEWKNGISLLELIQSKKKLLNSNVLIEPLFNILKFCLDQEEQSTFEYAKQLVLGCLLDCCKKLPAEDPNVSENNLNVELVVQCLRASPNPQTHHHALMLLSYLSALIPNQVMHNVMAIFTFMGTSVARLDDEHSVKIVTQVVDAVVPALVKAISSENDNLQIVIAEILRVFVWAVKDIPQHRRKPLLLQLLNTLLPENSLWIFLLLLLENHVLQGESKGDIVSIPPNHVLGLQLCLSISAKVVLESVVKIIEYLMQLPVEKMNKEGHIEKVQIGDPEAKNSDGLFDINAHTPKQLRHFSYTILVFINTLLADSNFIMQVGEQTNASEMNLEETLKETIAAIMKYTPMVRKHLEKQQTKFWKAMIHQCYQILDKFVLLVPNEMLLSVIKKLLNHSMKPLRRKALDLLNSLLQTHGGELTDEEKHYLKQLLDPVVEIIRSIGEETEQEVVLLQQTALFTLKLMAKLMSFDNIEQYKKILKTICNISKSKTVEGSLLGSVMLAIAELVTCLKAHSVSELPTFMPAMLKMFSKSSSPKAYNELLLNCITTAIHRVVDVLPHFLTPYLDNILFSVCTVSAMSQDKAELNKKLTYIRQKLGSSLEHRVLVPSVLRTYEKLISAKKYEATAPLFSTLSFSFTASSDVSKAVTDVSQLFISALSFRSNCETESQDVSMKNIDTVEKNIIEALIPFVLKLSESLFKPFYYQLFHWAAEHQDRSITFFRVSYSLAESLKGLFVLFAGHFLQKAANLLDATNLSKTQDCYFGNTPKGEMKATILLEYILKTLHSVFLYDTSDSSNFLNKEKFEVLLHPLVDQLENTLGGVEELEKRTNSLVTPCLAQMALATDDTLWKSLNYQILLKSKSILPQVRIGALETIVAIAVKLGDDYLILLPETVGSLAELLEDEDERVENAMKNAIQRLEDVLGQPIREYFQ